MSMTASLEQIAASFTGQLLQPAEAGYDEARRVHNGLIDKRPALIARCQGAADVADAVTLARTLNLEIAVRGGGHNVAGKATGTAADDRPRGDKGIHVDPGAHRPRRAACCGRDAGTGSRPPAAPSRRPASRPDPRRLGWLNTAWRWTTCSAEMVPADGCIVRASEQENADLFWGIRGGGGNFASPRRSNITSTR
jgi:hypothetical protein